MAPMELVGTIGEHDANPDVVEVAHQEAEQVARRLVGPVEVLDDEGDRGSRGQPLEHTEQQLEQPSLRRPDAQPPRNPAPSATGPRAGTRRASSERP